MNSSTQKLFMPGSRQKRPIRRFADASARACGSVALVTSAKGSALVFFKEQSYTDRENRTTTHRFDGHASCSSYSPTHHRDYSGHVLVKEKIRIDWVRTATLLKCTAMAWLVQGHSSYLRFIRVTSLLLRFSSIADQQIMCAAFTTG